MSEFVIEGTKKVKVEGEYDVIVVGGGIAGVSAAIAAKRNGLDVLVIEKSVFLGGLATLGLVVFYNCALDDGYGRKMMSGLPEELLHASIKYGYDTLPDVWRDGPEYAKTKQRYATIFNPYAFIVALDELMEQEKIDVLFDTLYSDSIMEDGWCKGLIVENKTGRKAYKAKVVVDATGDADVMERSGAKCVTDDNWLSYWAYSTNVENMKQAVTRENVYKGFKLEALGSRFDGKNNPPGMKKFKIEDAMEISEFIQEGRKMVLEKLKNADKKKMSLTTLPGMPQFRTTRRIEGLYLLSSDDLNKRFEDSIGCAAEEKKPFHMAEIPYRTLITENIKNIFAVGRIISAKGTIRDLTRLISPASMTGEAAGTAAKVMIDEGVDAHHVPIGRLQDMLKSQGVILHFQEVYDRYPGPTCVNPDEAFPNE